MNRYEDPRLDTPPPPILTPPTEVPPAIEPFMVRLRWSAIGLFFVLLIGMALFGREASREESRGGINSVSSQNVMSLRQALSMSSMALNLPEEARRQYEEQSRALIETASKNLREPSAKGGESAVLYAFTRYVLDQPIPEPLLAGLRESSNDALRAAGRVFSVEQLNAQDAGALVRRTQGLSDTATFVELVAREKSGDTRARAELFPASFFMRFAAIIGGIMVVLMAGALLWLLFAIMHKRPGWHARGTAFAHLDPDQASRLGMVGFAIMGCWLTVSLVLSLTRTTAEQDMILTGAILLPVMFAILHWGKINGQSVLPQLFKSDLSLGKQVLIGIGGALANAPIIAIVIALMLPLLQSTQASHPLSEMLADSPSVLGIVGSFFAAAIVAPIFEEIAFRGCFFAGLQAWMKQRRVLSFWLPALLTSFGFAAIHPQGPAAWLALGWVGMMGCILTYRTRSILPAIVMHAVHNGALVAMSLLMFS